MLRRSLIAGSLGKRLKRNAQFLRTQRYFAGMVYLELGVAAGLIGAGGR
jgi:hypothetical protein